MVAKFAKAVDANMANFGATTLNRFQAKGNHRRGLPDGLYGQPCHPVRASQADIGLFHGHGLGGIALGVAATGGTQEYAGDWITEPEGSGPGNGTRFLFWIRSPIAGYRWGIGRTGN